MRKDYEYLTSLTSMFEKQVGIFKKYFIQYCFDVLLNTRKELKLKQKRLKYSSLRYFIILQGMFKIVLLIAIYVWKSRKYGSLKKQIRLHAHRRRERKREIS